MPKVKVRTGMPSVQLDKAEFKRRFQERFYDPDFKSLSGEIDKIAETAWSTYDEYHKSPRVTKAGREFADPDYDISIEWLATRASIQAAERRQKNRKSPSRVLIVNGSSRSDKTCPGEMSKTYRLVLLAKKMIEKSRGFEVEILDLSRLTSEYGRIIYPCKACVSTAQPLCHWPCSCYPNHAFQQVGDWMNEIYERWVAAHAVILLTPCNWYHTSSPMKLMIDRLVCADGGNPDPTLTDGKDPVKAKKVELAGWPYPKHLAGRVYGVVVHGDVAGIEDTRRALSDWLDWMGFIDAGSMSRLDRYIGYYEPYATSHDGLDRDGDAQQEGRNVARAVAIAVRELRAGKLSDPNAKLKRPRPK